MTRTTQTTTRAALTGPRFAVTFTNGVWTIKDRQNYSHGRALNTEKQAITICADLNGGSQ